MKFIDSTEILIKSGHGGKGLVSFKAGPNQPKGGADGGDGGFGGNVYFLGNKGINTLSCLRYRQLYQAEPGAPGGPNGRTGRNGKDCVIPVPLGTEVYNAETGAKLCEIISDDEPVLVAEGGKRGLGNIRFLRANHQIPEESTPGGPSIELTVRCELKLIADIGLAGFPNAGKSTLLSRVSAAKPKIADYPFTTLTPQLGVVEVETDDMWRTDSFVMADIPGLIEGASDGRGLGHDFLKHLERTKVIAYVLDGLHPEFSCAEQYQKLRTEVGAFSHILARKDQFIVVTKSDVMTESVDTSEFAPDVPALTISAVRGDGINELKRALLKVLQKYREPASASTLPTLDEYVIYNA